MENIHGKILFLIFISFLFDVAGLVSADTIDVESCSASSTYGGEGSLDCMTLFDGIIEDGWAATNNQDTAWVDFSLTQTYYVDSLKVYNKESDWRVSSYILENFKFDSGTWERILDSTNIGYGETVQSELPETRTSRLRLKMRCNRVGSSSCQLKEVEISSSSPPAIEPCEGYFEDPSCIFDKPAKNFDSRPTTTSAPTTTPATASEDSKLLEVGIIARGDDGLFRSGYNSKVYIDDEFIGETGDNWIYAYVSPGSHTIKVTKSDYEDYQETFTVYTTDTNYKTKKYIDIRLVKIGSSSGSSQNYYIYGFLGIVIVVIFFIITGKGDKKPKKSKPKPIKKEVTKEKPKEEHKPEPPKPEKPIERPEPKEEKPKVQEKEEPKPEVKSTVKEAEQKQGITSGPLHNCPYCGGELSELNYYKINKAGETVKCEFCGKMIER